MEEEFRDGMKESYPFSKDSITLMQGRIAKLMDSQVPATAGSLELDKGYLSLRYTTGGRN